MSDTASAGKLNKVRDAAARLSLHPMSVYQLVYRGELRATRFGRTVRISDAALEQFIQDHTPALAGIGAGGRAAQ